MPLDIPLHRLHNQQISRQAFQNAGDVAAWLGALQGQDYAGAKWSVGLRLPGSTDAAVEKALDDRAILRTWLMRGTLHLVAAADIRWLLALVAPRLIAGNARRYRELELDEPTLARSSDLLASAVRGGKALSRPELFTILEQNGISRQGQRGVYMLQRASLEGLICQGAPRRNNPVFLSLDEAVPPARTMPRDESLAELAKRYFTSRGPATLEDFVTWSGLPTADARTGLEAAVSVLVADSINDQTHWRPESSPAAARRLYLLPGFDEYLLGYRHRSAVLDPQHAERVAPGKNGMFRATIVIEGRVAGTWKRTFKKGAVVIEPEPFGRLSAADRDAFAAAARGYAAFLELPAVLP